MFQKKVKYITALLCFLFFQSSFAFVTFYNHSTDDTLVVTYEFGSYVDSTQGWGWQYSTPTQTKPIPPMTAYKDENIIFPPPSPDQTGRYLTPSILVVTSVQATLPDNSIFIKNLNSLQPQQGIHPSCMLQDGDGNVGILFDTFNAQSDLFCTPGSG